MKQKTKLIIILTAEFIAISVVLLLIFFAGKKSYTVTFDLNGGILISGDLEQRVTQGHNATPPNAVKDGHYLRGWSGTYNKVTRNSTVKAIWEYVTSPGIIYGDTEFMNYSEIVGSHTEISGKIYVGAYYSEKIILTIAKDAFRDRRGITEMHLLDGILTIEEGAFAGCENMEIIDIPSTVKRIGKDAFAGCKSLKTIVLPEGLTTIEDGAFAGCESLEEIIIPRSVTYIGTGVFDTEGLTVILYPEDYNDGEEDEDNENEDNEDGSSDDNDVKDEIVRDFADGWYTDGVTVKYIDEDDENDNAEGGDEDKDSDSHK